MVAGFNFSSAVGRLGCGVLCDKMGAVNALLLSLIISAGSMLVLWPISTSLGPLIGFAILNVCRFLLTHRSTPANLVHLTQGIGNGAFFSCIPTVVSSVFGSARLSSAMSLVVTGWAGGYLLGAPIAVSLRSTSRTSCRSLTLLPSARRGSFSPRSEGRTVG